jgi:hypothetical protein
LLVFDAAVPGTPPVVLAPAWQGTPAFSEHSYRSLAVDRRRGEVFMMQYADATHGDWSFRDRNGGWHAGRIAWPPYAAGDLAPFNASHGRVNYPVVAVRDGGVHVFGPVAHDNWSRVKTPADLQLPGPPGKPASGLAARAFGNRWRRLLYAASPAVDRRGAPSRRDHRPVREPRSDPHDRLRLRGEPACDPPPPRGTRRPDPPAG